MSKREFFTLFSIGFMFFEIICIRICFFFNSTIGKNTFIASLLLYTAILIAILSTKYIWEKYKKNYIFAGALFFITLALCACGAIFFSSTYDTSWDGQGYHQIAIIALAHNWNPIYQPAIQLQQHLPGQIFAEGYPSALWEIQASIYSLTNKINTAKIANLYIAIPSFTLVWILLTKLKINKWLGIFISVLVVIQPIYVIQLNTFMQDGFGFQLIVIAVASLAIIIIDQNTLSAIAIFIMINILLVSTKYSNLPAALIFGAIFALVVVNRFMNKIYIFNKQTKWALVVSILVALFFSYIPYIRNQLAYNSILYPTNIPDLMGSVYYNNIPNNVDKRNKPVLLFYSIFSKSQSKDSGGPEAKENIAQLKIPFTFTLKEIQDSAALHNNRVGAAGPLFSGILTLSLLFLLFVLFNTKNIKQRYDVYSSFLAVGIILFLSILTPTPNLLRYVTQLQLLPFAIIIPIYAGIKNKYTTNITFLLITLLYINNTAFTIAVLQKNITETKQVNEQLNELRKTQKHLYIGIQQFYSNYIILNEQKIKFTAVNTLECSDKKFLVASSETSVYCLE